MSPSDDLILMGDFNLSSVGWSLPDDGDCLMPVLSSAPGDSASFIDSILSTGLSQSNDVPNDHNKFLDLVFSTDPYGTLVKHCFTPLVPESHHHPALHVVFSCDLLTSSPPSPCNYGFDFKKADYSALNSWLCNYDWSSLLIERDIEKAVTCFYAVLSLCFADCVPISPSTKSRVCQPWLDSSLKHLKNLRNKAWKRFCSSRCNEDFLAYSNLRDQFTSCLEISYAKYVERTRLALRNNPKLFWRFVNSKRKSDGYPSSMWLGDAESNDPLIIANLFADFFGTAFLSDNLDTSSHNCNHLTKLPSTTLRLGDLTFDDAIVSKYIANLADGFCAGPDGIPTSFLKNCNSSVSSILCHLFNLSIRSGRFPNAWKLSSIFPLHKSGNKCNISNYRPIAKLSSIGKLFEALVCDVLYFHCKPFLQSFQHGFIKGKSTVTNLLEFSNFCIPEIEAGNQIDCIYTDFSKAFDRINHTILISKLSSLGFPCTFISWISSYLTNRKQRVLFRDAYSHEIINSSGVPQGSHLGPLLFIIYINDVSLFLSHSKLLCYADDAKIFRSVSCYNDCGLLNADVNAFFNWCSNNHLPLNIDKCTTMSFHRRRSPTLFDYNMDGSSLSRLERTKDLGVIFNSRFAFNDHFDAIVSKANATLGFVKRWSKEFVDPYVTKILYCTFVRPILEYACPVWAPYFANHISRIEAVQRRFLLFALRGLPWSSNTFLPPYLDRLKLLSLESLEVRRVNARIIFAFDCLNGNINSAEIIRAFNVSVPSRSLRNHDFLQIPYHRTVYGANEPIASMSRLFNLCFSDIDFHINRSVLKKLLSLKSSPSRPSTY